MTLKEPTLREGVGEALEDAAQNNTLNLVQQRRPRKKAGRPPPKQEKEQQQDEWEEQEEEETPKGTGKQQRKKGRKLKYTQAPPQFQFSYRPRRGTPIVHPTRNRQRSRTGTGVSGGGILRPTMAGVKERVEREMHERLYRRPGTAFRSNKAQLLRGFKTAEERQIAKRWLYSQEAYVLGQTGPPWQGEIHQGKNYIQWHR